MTRQHRKTKDKRTTRQTTTRQNKTIITRQDSHHKTGQDKRKCKFEARQKRTGQILLDTRRGHPPVGVTVAVRIRVGVRVRVAVRIRVSLIMFSPLISSCCSPSPMFALRTKKGWVGG